MDAAETSSSTAKRQWMEGLSVVDEAESSAYASKELGYRGTVEEPANTFALRNPFFGIGLLPNCLKRAFFGMRTQMMQMGTASAAAPITTEVCGCFGSKPRPSI